jgi:tetratricopeptide (TPR) repeat protein
MNCVYIKTGILSLFTWLVLGNSIAQVPTSLQDQNLEILLKENKLNEAQSLINEKLNSNPSQEQSVYYFNKASQIQLNLGNFQEALSWAKKSEKVLEDIPESKLIGDGFRALCFSYIRLGKLDSALFYAEKLYDDTKIDNNLNLRRAALMAMGNISLQNKKYQKSLSFYKEALETTESLGDSLNLKVDLYNVGLSYATLKNYPLSDDFLKRAAVRAEKEGDKRLLARIFGTLADNNMDLNNFSEQILNLNKANKIALELGDKQLLAMGYSNLMQTYMRQNRFAEAIELGEKSIELLKEKPTIQLEAKVDSVMYVSFKALGDFQKAVSFLESYDAKKERIRGNIQKAKLEELTLEFEVEKKNLLIESQQAELKIEKTRNRSLILALMSSLAVLALISYIYTKKNKTRQLLFKKEREFDQEINTRRLLQESQLSFDKNLKKENFENSSDSSLENPQTKTQLLFLEVIDLIEKKKLYLDLELNQKSMAEKLGTNRQYLYEAINQHGDENFRGLINRIRINETKKIIEEAILSNKTINFSSLHELVGFRSFSTYYRAFKSLTGLTPNEYASEFKKVSSIFN